MKTATSSPSRWTWIARAVELPLDRGRRRSSPARRRRRRAGEASIGRDRAADLQPDRRAAPAAPSASAAAATSPRSPRSITRAAQLGGGTPAARATASTITPSSAPWRSSPEQQRAQEALLALGGAREQRAQRVAARGLRAGARQRADARRTPRRPRQARASARPPAAAGRCSDAQPTPIWRWRSSPERKATADRRLVGRQPRAARSASARPSPCARCSRARPRWRGEVGKSTGQSWQAALSATSCTATCGAGTAHAVGLAGAQCDALVRPAPGGAVGMHRVGDLLPPRVAGVPARGGGAHAAHVRAAVAGHPVRPWLVLRANQLWAPYPDNDADGARRAWSASTGSWPPARRDAST